MNIAINGFGRIGRQALRILETKYPSVDVVLINDLTEGGVLAHLFKYDSTYGTYAGDVSCADGTLVTKSNTIRLTAEKDPQNLPHRELRVDIVLECTGRFTKREDAALHLKAGAKKVIISAPAKDAVDGTFVIGVNHDRYDPTKMHVISNASCTTNCLAPMLKVLQESFGIEKGFMTTTHSYTNDQELLDLPHKDLRRARAAAVNIVPTTTGAAKAIGLVLPELEGKMDGVAIRVPTPTGSINDVTVIVRKDVTAEDVNDAYEEAARGSLAGVLRVEHAPIVSRDIVGDPMSCIIDAALTSVMGGTLVNVFGWYDNEWGYSNRLVELARYVGSRLQ